MRHIYEVCFDSYILEGDEDTRLAVIVTVYIQPGTPDVMYLPNGDPGYPGDPAELYDWSIDDRLGRSWDFEDLCEQDQQRLESEAWTQWQENNDLEPEDF